jgi:poly(A) polymerase Pap1
MMEELTSALESCKQILLKDIIEASERRLPVDKFVTRWELLFEPYAFFTTFKSYLQVGLRC